MHPSFILGSTGKPKGIQHCTGGYLVYASFTQKYIFDLKGAFLHTQRVLNLCSTETDVYACVADIG